MTEMEIQSVMDDISKAPPIPAPAARDDRYVAFAEYVKDRHCWMDAWIDIWVSCDPGSAVVCETIDKRSSW